MSSLVERIKETKELAWRVPLGVAFIVVLGVMHSALNLGDADQETAWLIMVWYGFILIITAQISSTAAEFFTGKGIGIWGAIDYVLRGARTDGNQATDPASRAEVGFWTLMPSAFITWIFAKSINNSAIWGSRYGILGGIAYAGFYMSFFSAAAVGYILRTRHGYTSLPVAVEKVYGPFALLGFGIMLFYRLWNEVWSNTAVVASFYSAEVWTPAWWASAWVSAIIPGTYVIMGGMRSSLVSDVLQAGLGVIFLFVIIGVLGSEMPGGSSAVFSYQPADGWQDGGITWLVAALIQGTLSYPFHDPVLTDRTFLSRPDTMVASFAVGGSLAIMFIILFSVVGIYATITLGVVGVANPPAHVARALGGGAFAFINLVMMTSSMSTLDSTFTSASKLIALEFGGWFHLPGDSRDRRAPLKPNDTANVGQAHILLARGTIVVLAVVGTLYLYVDQSSISGTTVSGTMVMGLGPPVWLLCFWKYNSKPGADDGWRQSPLAFLFSWATGAVFGVMYTLNGQKVGDTPAILSKYAVGNGSGAIFLGWNIFGHGLCFAACLVGFIVNQYVWKLPTLDAEVTVEHHATGERLPKPGYEAAAASLAKQVDQAEVIARA